MLHLTQPHLNHQSQTCFTQHTSQSDMLHSTHIVRHASLNTAMLQLLQPPMPHSTQPHLNHHRQPCFTHHKPHLNHDKGMLHSTQPCFTQHNHTWTIIDSPASLNRVTLDPRKQHFTQWNNTSLNKATCLSLQPSFTQHSHILITTVTLQWTQQSFHKHSHTSLNIDINTYFAQPRNNQNDTATLDAKQWHFYSQTSLNTATFQRIQPHSPQHSNPLNNTAIIQTTQSYSSLYKNTLVINTVTSEQHSQALNNSHTISNTATL